MPLMLRNPYRLAYLAAAATVLLWGLAFVGIRVAVRTFSPLHLTASRLFVASVVLGCIARVLHISRPSLSDFPAIALCALLGMPLYQLLLNTGEQGISAGAAGLLIGLSPLCSIVLARIFLAERIGNQQKCGLAIAVVGAVTIALGHGQLVFGFSSVFVVGAAICQASFFLLQKGLLRRYSALTLTCFATWIGTLMVGPFVVLGNTTAVHVSTLSIVATLALGIGPSAMGFVLWAYALSRLSIATTSVSLYGVQAVAVFGGAVLLQEPLSHLAVFGGILTAIGAWMCRRPTQQLPHSTPATYRAA